ncbi:AraC family transcriptional regulator [Actinomadura pelletieri DSM 43383]|uniref:AraC family transcriptional regulator n=1 Tax=Actinomadura pelletieri DSM 43383 TaxID=1120940 RepID=A0A495QJE0_9ACTN|nr:helix-turn-helix domain-containing protein [Actinomadura pelletieri]RKS72282.1 AraC family transcriptional regulator [Actinomadura pelletieri DSM 43383]
MPAPAQMISQASTEEVDPRERIEFWEDYNRRALVGLSCSSYSDRGLLARQANFKLGDVELADISGNAHAIERTPKVARSAPKDSVFASLLVTGEAVFLHENGCLSATSGDLVVYDTRRPYLFGFSSSMRQLLVDIPRDLFAELCMPGGVPAPMLFGRGTAREGELVVALRSVLENPRGGDPAGAGDTVLDLIRMLATERSGGRAAPAAYQTQRIVAEDYIERHLHDTCLTPSQVAGVMGVSVRHLGRIFESAGTTPSRYILERRLQRAHDDLTAPGAADTTIADIAYRWGFSSQAHFARHFRARFGRTPTETRAATAAR